MIITIAILYLDTATQLHTSPLYNVTVITTNIQIYISISTTNTTSTSRTSTTTSRSSTTSTTTTTITVPQLLQISSYLLLQHYYIQTILLLLRIFCITTLYLYGIYRYICVKDNTNQNINSRQQQQCVYVNITILNINPSLYISSCHTYIHFFIYSALLHPHHFFIFLKLFFLYFFGNLYIQFSLFLGNYTMERKEILPLLY